MRQRRGKYTERATKRERANDVQTTQGLFTTQAEAGGSTASSTLTISGKLDWLIWSFYLMSMWTQELEFPISQGLDWIQGMHACKHSYCLFLVLSGNFSPSWVILLFVSILCLKVYHIARNMWSKMENRTVKNVSAPAAVIDEKIYIIGGMLAIRLNIITSM